MSELKKFKAEKRNKHIKQLRACHMTCDASIRRAELKLNNDREVTHNNLETILSSISNMCHEGDLLVDNILKYS